MPSMFDAHLSLMWKAGAALCLTAAGLLLLYALFDVELDLALRLLGAGGAVAIFLLSWLCWRLLKLIHSP